MRLAQMPKGTLVYKKINGKEQPYLQWTENGKSKSKYIKQAERETVLADMKLKKWLSSEAKKLREEIDFQEYSYDSLYAAMNTAEQEALDSYNAESSIFATRVIRGEELERQIASAEGLQKRDCYEKLREYLQSDIRNKVCVLYGLRRTGKTTLINQAIAEMSKSERKKAAYIKVNTDDVMSDMDRDLILLSKLGYKYIFVDEATAMEDFIRMASIFSDIYAPQGMKIVLSGTDSLGFWMTLTGELFDRAVFLHTTHIPFREYSRLLGVDDIDEYIKYGGILKSKNSSGGDEIFKEAESTDRYITSAISRNIQHALAHTKDGIFFRHLLELYENDELTDAINRTVERMNHRFLLSTLLKQFESRDLGSANELLRKEKDPAKRSDILELIDKTGITTKLKESLEIKDVEDRSVGLRESHVTEIKEYLYALDLVLDCPLETMSDRESLEYCLFTQPGLRYSQTEALLDILSEDASFNEFGERERNLAKSKIREDVMGRMLEDIVLLETAKVLERQDAKRTFKLLLGKGEIDMVIYDAESDSCELYEVKHSSEIDPMQYHLLEDEAALNAIAARYGRIASRNIIYRGEPKILDNGIRYINSEEYLKGLGREWP